MSEKTKNPKEIFKFCLDGVSQNLNDYLEEYKQ
jgi:hypothetical protein